MPKNEFSLKLQLLLIILLTFVSTHGYASVNQVIYGWHEPIEIMPYKINVEGKLDTGANMASLDARDMHYSYKQGKLWVNFSTPLNDSDNKLINIEKPVLSFINIKERSEESDEQPSRNSERPVIALDVCLDNHLRTLNVNLIDRTKFEYRMLLGRQAITAFSGLIDVNLTSTSKPTC